MHVEMVEIDGCDHRAILRDELVVAKLLDHCCMKVVRPGAKK